MKRILFLSSQCTLRAKCGAWAFVVIAAMLWATAAQAQVESLEPNPLEPAGAGSAGVLEFQGPRSGGVHLGRTPRGQAVRSTRHTAPHRGAAHAPPSNTRSRQPPSRREREPVHVEPRGGDAHGRYATRSSYRQRAPQRAPAARATRPRWY